MLAKISRLLVFFGLFSVTVAVKAQAHFSVQEMATPSLGLKGWLHEDHSVPVVSLVLSFRSGGCYAPETKAGIADLLSEMLLEGAGDLKTQEFHEALGDLGIELSTRVDFDRLTFTLRTPRQHLDKALSLLSLVLHKPRFDHDAFERVKKAIIAEQKNTSQTPDWIAARQLEATFYGTHPYSRPVEGTVESLSTINVRDVSKFMKDHFSLDRVRWAVSGDITPQDLGASLDKLLSGLPEKGFRRRFTQAKAPSQGSEVIQYTPHPQVKVYFAHKGLPHAHEDFMMYYLVTYILGGGSEARLSQKIRDEAGLAYYAYASGQTYRYSSTLSGALGTKGASARQAVEKVRDIFRELKKKGITEQELEQAKKHLIGRFPMGFTSSKQIASVLHAFQIFRFQPDYFDKREGLIRGLKLEKMNAFARDFFDPDSLVFSLAGAVPQTTEDSETTTNEARVQVSRHQEDKE